MKTPQNERQTLVELSEEQLKQVSGGDNPGMGSYDGYGDHSLPYNDRVQCGWTDYGRGVYCVLN